MWCLWLLEGVVDPSKLSGTVAAHLLPSIFVMIDLVKLKVFAAENASNGRNG
jgi:hypothetical protein